MPRIYTKTGSFKSDTTYHFRCVLRERILGEKRPRKGS